MICYYAIKNKLVLSSLQVIRSWGLAAYLELEPQTGVRHQLRVHLSEAINCQVLGDHKYAHPERFAPQKLPEDMLKSLNVQQSKVRNIPMHLHAASIEIPELGPAGQSLVIHASLPAFFRLSMKKLKLNSDRNRT